MLRSQIRKRLNRLRFRLSLSSIRWNAAVGFQLLIDSIVRAADKSAILFIAFNDCNAEMFAIGSHLRDVDRQRALHNQVNLARALHRYRAVCNAIFFGDPDARERSVFELNVDSAMKRPDRCQIVYLRDKLSSRCLRQRSEKFFYRNLLVYQIAAGSDEYERGERDCNSKSRSGSQEMNSASGHQSKAGAEVGAGYFGIRVVTEITLTKQIRYVNAR